MLDSRQELRLFPLLSTRLSNTWAWLDELSRRAGGRRSRERAGREWDELAVARVRRRLADGRVAAEPGRASRSPWRTRRSSTTSGARFPTARRRRRRLAVLHPRLRRRRPPRRAGGARPRARGARRRGLGLILDFVPNHVAPDHPWTAEHPELFVRAPRRPRARPGGVRRGRRPCRCQRPRPVLPGVAGRRPAQRLRPDLRSAAVETLRSIADQCDGVRCDMAMLVMNDMFARTWGDRVGPAAEHDYWPTVIPAVRADPPRLRVHRRGLLGPGVGAAAAGLRLLLRQAALRPARRAGAPSRSGPTSAQTAYQNAARPVRREPRRAPRGGDLPAPRRAAAAVATLTQTGARLVHDGQLRGSAGAASGVPRPLSRRAGRRRPARVLRAAARVPRRRPSFGGRVAARRACGLDGNAAWSRSSAGAGTVTRAGSSWSTSATDGRRTRLAPVGRPARHDVAPRRRRRPDVRTEWRRPPRRAVRRASAWGFHLRRGACRRRGRQSDRDDEAADDRRTPPARRGDGSRRGRPVHREPVVRVGPVPERAGVGHGPRGLLRERRRVELVPARPRAVARLPLERGRHGRDLRHPPRAVPRARALERPRPDPQGAHVRSDGTAGQPRRGRQGVLVVPRGAAEPRAASLALSLPAGGVPLRASSSTTAAACRTRSSSSSTRASSTTTGTGRSR